MKVLFISSGRNSKVGNVVWNQGESLKEGGLEIDYFLIRPGFFGYINAIPKIRMTFKKGNYNLAHAHYSLSGFSAAFAGCSPLVVSLMGSDAFMSRILRTVAWIFYRYIWDATILKTGQMKELLNMTKAKIIPNGVDINRFRPMPVKDAREDLGLPFEKNLILFVSTPNRPEKNLELAQLAIKEVNNSNVVLLHVYNVPNDRMPVYYNSADALLVTSKWEGSTNVVKEAMACNCPIISTNVGDIEWMIGDTIRCQITSDSPGDISECIKAVITTNTRTDGRNKIIFNKLDSVSISARIKELYASIIKE